MPINASPEYLAIQKKYLQAKTKEEKVKYLEELITFAPKHKGSENLLANLKARLAKLKKEIEIEKARKKKIGKKEGIKRTGDAQAVILGLTLTGKSTLLSALTNAKPKISPYGYTTQEPEIGVLNYEGCEIQIIEMPPLTGIAENDGMQLSIAKESDLIILIATSKEELEKAYNEIKEARINKKILFVINRKDAYMPLGITQPFILISAMNKENIEELKLKIFQNLDLLRIYTKEPSRKTETRPMIMKKGDTVKDLCEKIRKDFTSRFLFARVYGKSAKFGWQRTGLNHKLEDKDIVEIHLKD